MSVSYIKLQCTSCKKETKYSVFDKQLACVKGEWVVYYLQGGKYYECDCGCNKVLLKIH